MMTAILISVPLWPLLAALLILLFKKRLERAAGAISVTGVLLSLLSLLILWGEEMRLSAVWFAAGDLTVTVGLMLDSLSYYLSLVVAGVSLVVTLYAVGYMSEAAYRARFFIEFSFFIGAMLALVLADSFLLLYGAWEGVGLASFLLIGYSDRKKEARDAAQRAFLMTRLGDMGLLLGWVWILILVGTTGIPEFLSAIENGGIPETVLILTGLFFLAAALGKSAQLPLSAWLPDAMIGPTPVSALLHSATMVAAGAYLLLRLYPLFYAAPGMLTVVAVIGGITALFAALVATSLYDFKRILAWSTISHLGKMMFAVGLAGPVGAAYHLGTHACFKSTLFLTAGAVEHGTGTRDIRQLGGLTKMMPLTASVAVLAAVTLAGVPPFSGFWSEDVILGAALSKGPVLGGFMVLLVFLSALYIGRAVMAVVGEWPGSGLPDTERPYRSMGIAMLILGLAALFIGLLLHGSMEKIVPYGSKHSVPLVWKVIAGLAAVAGLVVGAWRVKSEGPVPAMGWFPRKMSDGLYWVTHLPVAGTMVLSRFLNVVETGLDRGVAGGALSTASKSRRIETGLDRGSAGIAGGVLATASGSRRVERGLDAGAQGLSRATFGAAYASDRAEHRGFSDGLDAFGRSLAFAGHRLKAYQSGLLYHYTLGLTIWVVIMGAIGVVVLVAM